MTNRLRMRVCGTMLAGYLAACEGADTSSNIHSGCAVEAGTVRIAAAKARLGAARLYPEEQTREVELDAFDIDRTEVTNAQFAAFIEETGYVTTAERAQPDAGVPGGGVFRPPTASQPTWWHFVEGASWRHPEGPTSNLDGRENEPVVQVSLEDARAYADWAGRRIPTEDEWEYAATAGAQTLFPWGAERAPNGVSRANGWQGAFPVQNSAADGYAGRSPVGCFPANALGLHDMIGNVWEWTETPFRYGNQPEGFMIKGGSFLCAPSYCQRDRGAARQSQEADFSTNHTGFRTVSR